MSDSGHQHHHGVTKNIVEGIGGVVIGAAAVLLLARFFKGKSAKARPSLPAPPEAEVASPAAIPAAPEVVPEPVKPARRPPTRRARPATAEVTAEVQEKATVAKPRRSRKKPVAETPAEATNIPVGEPDPQAS